MKKILVFQHVGHEILGTLHPLIKDAGLRIRYVNFGRHPDAEAKIGTYDGLVILGGPMGVWEKDKHPHLVREIECIQETIAQKKPVLGICLGAQLIASALGAEVKPAKQKEIGWCKVTLTNEGKEDPVVGGLHKTEKVFQWHYDAFALPKDSAWLAKSDACQYQAFRHGDRTYGFQFHLEVDTPMIDRWLTLPANQSALTDEERETIRRETAERIGHNLENGTQVFKNYLDLFCTKKKNVVLGCATKIKK